MSATGLLFETTLKTSIVVLAALAAAALSRRQSAAVRHWILASAILCTALVPILGSVVPRWDVPIAMLPAAEWIATSSVRLPDGAAIATERQRQPTEARPLPEQMAAGFTTSSRVVVAIWIAGVLVSLSILCLGLGRLAWIGSRSSRMVSGRWTDLAATLASEYGLRHRVQLLQTDHPAMLVTWGHARPRILLPAGATHWGDERVRVVLSHELAHVKRNDWLILIAAEIVLALYWFNPLVWVACRRLRQESEHATDDAVLNGGVRGTEYAEHLLDLARILADRGRRAWAPAPAIARPSSLERRVRAMLNARTSRGPATRPARLVTIAAVSCLTAALAAAQGAFATFSGTVFDETNGFVPGATLILTNPQSQAKYEVVSDRSGRFEFVGLPPGDYQLETKVMGFATLRGTLTLAGQNAQRDLVLKIGSLEETITVRGPATNTGSSPSTSRRPTRRPDPTCTDLPAGGMGGNIRAPHKLVDVKPHYPPQLYEAGVGGTVVLQARIDPEGRVDTVEVVSPAHPDLNAAAIEAVRQWEFDSTILNCTKVDVAMKVTANFVAGR